jgi:hypothetical protein
MRDWGRENAVRRGVAFLRGRQLPSGRFRTVASRYVDLRNAKEDSSVFTTAVLAYSLSFCKWPEVHEMKEAALDFLLREMHAPGFWRYWTSDSSNTIPIDLDDTACASLAMSVNGRSFPANFGRIGENRDKNGRFLTWLFDERLKSFKEDLPVTERWNIDPVVNANLLAYLGYQDDMELAVGYVMEWTRSDDHAAHWGYYVDRLALYYAVSRACYRGVSPLCNARARLKSTISSRLRTRRDWNILSSAFAACTLLNLSETSEDLWTLAHEIVAEQRPDGSWPAIAMYVGPTRFHGSAELTTGLCLEALERLRGWAGHST